MKKCKRCGVLKEKEMFVVNNNRKDGMGVSCKKCHNEIAKEYRQKNPQKVKMSRSKWIEKVNQQGGLSLKEYLANWRKKNKEKSKEYLANWKEKYGYENSAIYKLNWSKKNKEHIKAYNIWYRKNNKDNTRMNSHKRRVRIRGGQFEVFSNTSIFERDGYVCGICGQKINRRLKYPNPMSVSLDHIIPICKGGGHIVNNVQASHLSCNVRKSDKQKGQLLLAMF